MFKISSNVILPSLLYNKAVNTFRIITYRGKTNFITCLFYESLIGETVVDNGASGGMFIRLTLDATLTYKVGMSCNTSIEFYFDSGVIFKGYK